MWCISLHKQSKCGNFVYMAEFIRKYRRLFAVLSLSVAAVFMLTTVSIAYTSIFCKMNKTSEKRVVKSCCHPEGKEIEVKSENNDCTMYVTKNGPNLTRERHKCCCSISKTDTPLTPSSSATQTNLTHTKIQQGTLVSILSNPTNNNSSIYTSTGDRAPTQGRSIFILVSNFRI